MRSDRLSSVRMNARATLPVSPRLGLCLAASILGLLFLASALAPGTVLSSAAANVYTEEPPPPTPTNNNNGNNNGNGGTQTGSGNNNGGGTGDSDSDDSGTGTSYDSGDDGTSTGGSGSGDSGDSSDKKDEKKSDDKRDRTKAESDSDSSDSAAAATTSGDDGDSGGGSALPWIIAILVGVPLIGGGAWYLWQRYRGDDDETREKLKSALSGKSSGTT